MGFWSNPWVITIGSGLAVTVASWLIRQRRKGTVGSPEVPIVSSQRSVNVAGDVHQSGGVNVAAHGGTVTIHSPSDEADAAEGPRRAAAERVATHIDTLSRLSEGFERSLVRATRVPAYSHVLDDFDQLLAPTEQRQNDLLAVPSEELRAGAMAWYREMREAVTAARNIAEDAQSWPRRGLGTFNAAPHLQRLQVLFAAQARYGRQLAAQLRDRA
jgi:hypothetical protein